MEDKEESIRFAKQYLEDLLSFFGLNTDVHATFDDEVICLGVPSTHLNGFLIGQNGETMRSLQYLVGMALKAAGRSMQRVSVDVADYKLQRQQRVAEQAEIRIKQVKDSGKVMELRPMAPADRRVIHKLASDAGLTTESVGEGFDRHIVISPSGAPEEQQKDDDTEEELAEASVSEESTPENE